MLTALLNNKYLIRELVSRDVHTRYVGSLAGIFWSILNPLFQLLIYTVVFSKVLDVDLGGGGGRLEGSGGAGKFALYLFCALLPWMAVQEAITRSSRSFIENSNLIKKMRFPLETLPLGAVLSAFIHQCLGTLIFLVALAIYQSIHFPTLPLVVLLFALQLLMMYGLSLTVACLNVFVRDVAQILGVFFMMMFWMTPIVYPKRLAPPTFRWILELNPFTHMVEAFRFVFLGNPQPAPLGILYWAVFSAAALWMGRLVLRRTRKDLVDLI